MVYNGIKKNADSMWYKYNLEVLELEQVIADTNIKLTSTELLKQKKIDNIKDNVNAFILADSQKRSFLDYVILKEKCKQYKLWHDMNKLKGIELRIINYW